MGDIEETCCAISVVREYYLAHPEQARAVLLVWERLHRAPIPVHQFLADPSLPPAIRVRVEEAARNAPGSWRQETARAQLAERNRLTAAAILVEVAGAQTVNSASVDEIRPGPSTAPSLVRYRALADMESWPATAFRQGDSAGTNAGWLGARAGERETAGSAGDAVAASLIFVQKIVTVPPLLRQETSISFGAVRRTMPEDP